MSRRDEGPSAFPAWLGDLGCIVAALVLGGMATDATDVATGSYATVNDLVGIAAVASLWWRRRAPLVVAALTFVAGGVAPLAGGAALVSVYTVAARCRSTRSSRMLALYGLYVASGVASLVLFPDDDLDALGSTLLAAVLTAAAYGWGLAVRSRRELLEALAERAERAEGEQQARVAEARRGERARIASEMHDVLAHRLSLLSLHAGAIELRPDAPTEDLAAAAAVVRSNAHLALDDLRAVIGVMRDGSHDQLAPLPTIADLDELVAECREAGMRLEVTDTTSRHASMPAELGRHAYEVAREALTNARKHAPGQEVRLMLAGDATAGLRIEVVNAVRPPTTPPTSIPGAGVGLVGLAERVALAGGHVDHGLDGNGQHRLDVWLPWPT